ncbi:L-2-hydroxyisocaproate dehydrogenase [Limosilactobacillus frumenti DSM 13145]|uniref:L-2-hydroxyisocaproate dehydrogenase n=1 Tax=Limosilactobacillus frumenti DSM 13145 TaxID=1423746 RepID=A0A0R1PBZ7_9LACO|nr:malate dehydrogenase [Limosilactobacillus frumenti]KRL26155.1 L-2-hydroxyisocaproate dehydrogenase [Limosilactobacillus frumenti DSM 13145]MBA2913674.1 malate dehydrogenase [Limosilactobacillus frumenti]QFG72985.1 malate dehydrogenase [Limosilactobacillus frumenti]
MRSIGIIGLGHVGRQLATQLVTGRQVDRLTLIDQDDDLALAIQTDLTDLAGIQNTYPEIIIQDWAALANSEIVVTAFGKSKLQTQTTDAELTFNQQAACQVADQLKSQQFAGILINVADPNEAVTAYLQEKAALPPKHVLGVGTSLETIHMRRAVAHAVQLSPANVSGFVYGQHNGQQVFAWSTVKVNGQSLDQSLNGHHVDLNQAKVRADMNNWYTLHGMHYNAAGIAGVVVQIIQAILENQNLALPLAIYQPQYNTYVSFPTLINRQGQGNLLLLKLYPVEENAVKVAATAVQSQLASLRKLEGEHDD